MQTKTRFNCPGCGQEFVSDSAWVGRGFTCSSCSTVFTVPVPPVEPFPSLPATEASPSRAVGKRRLLGSFFALLTPICLGFIAFLCVDVGWVVGGIIAGVVIGFVSACFAKWYVQKWGAEAFGYYKRSASACLVGAPLLVAAAFISFGSEASGLVLPAILVAGLFVSVLIAFAWLVGIRCTGWRD